MSLKERIRAAFSITRQAAAKREDLDRVEAMLYAMADKFLDGADLNEIKEGIRMTRLGQMLVNEGIEQGIQRGIEQGIQQEILPVPEILKSFRGGKICCGSSFVFIPGILDRPRKKLILLTKILQDFHMGRV